MNGKSAYLFIFIFCSTILFLTFKGLPGNPGESDLLQNRWRDDGPFELSPERGRFALTYSIVEKRSFHFSTNIARFIFPDVAYKDGRYVSLFAPGVSYLLIPGYLAGRMFGYSQAGSFLEIALFAILNVLLINLILGRLNTGRIPSLISSFVFLFATPAFAYAGSLYQHHISTFIILLGLFLALRSNSIKSTILIFMLYGLSFVVDYPNLILMMPVAIYSLGKSFFLSKDRAVTRLSVDFKKIFLVVSFLAPLTFLVWFNVASYNTPFTLSGSQDAVASIKEDGNPILHADLIRERGLEIDIKKDVVGYFNTDQIIKGLFTHLFSPDRGAIIFTPIIFLGFLGLKKMTTENSTQLQLILGIISMNVILYSMWSDPWGGWAFGSRYLIPSYAMLSILIGASIQKYGKNLLFIVSFLILAIYSVSVNALGILTTSANPPKEEALYLNNKLGNPIKYTLERNVDFLTKSGLKSFSYNKFFSGSIDPNEYYIGIVFLISMTFVSMMLYLYLRNETANTDIERRLSERIR